MDGTTTTFGKLLPKSITAKRKSRRQRLAAEPDTPSALDEAVGGGGPGYEDDNSSLFSFDSSLEPDPAVPRRPASASSPPNARPAVISAHASQIGYLTTSSPLVQATHLDSQQPAYLPPSRAVSNKLARGVRNPRAPSPASSVQSRGSPTRSLTLETTAAPERRPRPPQPRLDTRSPKTPPTADPPAAPLIVSTPPTPVDRVGVAGGSLPDRTKKSPHHGLGSSSPSQSMSTHWRSRSASSAHLPSKLSSTVLSPLTPTAETAEDNANAPGFFSSVLSAAQNAASTINNNIPGTAIGIGGNRGRSSLNRTQGSSVSVQVEPEPKPRPAPVTPAEDPMDAKKESAVQTLGNGDLSLSQLGIADSIMASPTGAKFSDASDSRARSDSAPVESQTRASEALLEEPTSRPRSLVEVALGDQTPPQADTDTKASSLQRTSSLRSAMKPHRKRGSSATTGSTKTTAGAALAAAHSTVSYHPSASFAAPKLTGFAIASKKRNRDFHSLFKSVPDDDYLIEDYSCALQREILAHGRLYVSEGHLCFSSNILGWTTMLVMSFDEIVSVEKRSTALVFKNGLMISTLHAKHIFASFTGRDATYDVIVNIWKLGHPTLRSTLNGVRLEGIGGDKTEKVDGEPSAPDTEVQDGSDSDNSDEDEFYEENEHVVDTQASDPTGADVEPEKPAARKASGVTIPNGSLADAPKEGPSLAGGAVDFPGPATHSPTDCGDAASHYEKVIGDDVIAAPLGKVYNLIFGPGSVEWMAKWLTGEQKCTELQMEDRKGLSLDNKSRSYSYIKPLSASLGPKQTKCIVTETVENCDLDKAVNLSVSSQTPDVPSGNIFTVKTRYCLSWAENNATRLQVNCTTEWSGKSWLRGPIEKGVGDGQAQYFKDLCAALKAAVSSQPRLGAVSNGPMRGKRAKRSKTLQAADGEAEGGGGPSHADTKNWGPLESVRGLVESCMDVVRPVLTGNVMYGILVGLLVAMWFGFGSSPSKSPAAYGPDMGIYSAHRLAAYEEMWRREESELWSWLEERVGLDRLGSESAHAGKAAEPRALENRLREGQMDEREVEEAIRVTEEKLKVLKEVVGRTSREGGHRR